MNYIVKKIEDRFWEKVDKSGDCWVWTRAKGSSGYGAFELPTHKAIAAHRMAWILTNGEIPKGKLVLHRCDNRPCVNPSHLFLGTPKENSLDMVSKNRQAKGDRHGRKKLSLDSANKIRALVGKGMTKIAIGKQFGVSHDTVNRIANGEVWIC